MPKKPIYGKISVVAVALGSRRGTEVEEEPFC